MRHRAMFQTDLTVEQVCSWLVGEFNKLGFTIDGEVLRGNYDHSLSVIKNHQQLSFSIFENPTPETNLCIYVEPKLGFINAMLRKTDVAREQATILTHEILSHSTQVSRLGWYTDTQVWKGGTKSP